MRILKSVKLLIPAIIPSWNFFDSIAPSPRIQFSLLKSETDAIRNWQEFRPRPQFVSLAKMLKRMVWNPRWNESLFLVSCAERIVGNSSPELIIHSEHEILKRIKNDLLQKHKSLTASHIQFRLLFMKRQDSKIKEEVAFISRIQALATKALT